MAAATALTLYACEDNLTCLVDSAETVTPEQEQQFLADFGAALLAAADKRDRVAQYLAHLEAQQAFATQEITRLQDLKAWYARQQERLEGYVCHVIEAIGLDAKGKFRKLEGRISVLSVRQCPDTVNLTDEAAVPAEYKTATVSLPATLWEEVIGALDIDLAGKVLDAVKNPKLVVSKTAVKEAISAKREVPGASMSFGKLSLVRK